MPYSPLGRGFLTGKYKRTADFVEGDYRRSSPRFMDDNLERNLEIVRQIEALAARKQCTPPQLALAWLLAQGEDIVPIPGTKRRKYLEENLASLNVELTAEDLKGIHEAVPVGAASGDRYPEWSMKALNR